MSVQGWPSSSNLVLAHGGELEITSEEGEGTTVRFTLAAGAPERISWHCRWTPPASSARSCPRLLARDLELAAVGEYEVLDDGQP